jgi:hypothetical protein
MLALNAEQQDLKEKMKAYTDIYAKDMPSNMQISINYNLYF